MGKKAKAPDMSFQIEAAQKQEAEMVRQRAEIETKQQQTAVANTDKLKGLRRRQSGRGMLDMSQNTYVPQGAPTPVYRTPEETQRLTLRDMLRKTPIIK